MSHRGVRTTASSTSGTVRRYVAAQSNCCHKLTQRRILRASTVPECSLTSTVPIEARGRTLKVT